MYNIASGCDHGNLCFLRKTSAYFNLTGRQASDKTETKCKKTNTQKNTKQTKKPPCNTTTAMHEPDEMLPSLRRAELYMQKLCHASNKQLELLKQDMVKLRIVLFPF